MLLFALKPATCQALTSGKPLIQVLPEHGGSTLLVKKIPAHMTLNMTVGQKISLCDVNFESKILL
jgi:hypothetical protein